MICAKCAAQLEEGSSRCSACEGDPLLAGRYRLDEELARDPGGLSYRATRVADGLRVRARACVGVELEAFRRQCAQLEALDHRNVPGILEALSEIEADAASCWLISEHEHASSLGQLVRDRGTLDESELFGVMRELGALLVDLAEQQPPVRHPSLGPASVLRRTEDGRLLLVDFNPGGPEPAPRAELRGLGLLAITLLTGREPVDGDAPEDWRERATNDEELADLLEDLIAEPEARIDTATAVEIIDRLDDAVCNANTTRRMSSAELAASADSDPDEEPNDDRKEQRRREDQDRGPSTVSGQIGERASASASLPRQPKPKPKPVRRAKAKDKADVPVMRPEDLSRELSQAFRATHELELRQRQRQTAAKLTIIATAALVAALLTWLVFAFSA